MYAFLKSTMIAQGGGLDRVDSPGPFMLRGERLARFVKCLAQFVKGCSSAIYGRSSARVERRLPLSQWTVTDHLTLRRRE